MRKNDLVWMINGAILMGMGTFGYILEGLQTPKLRKEIQIEKIIVEDSRAKSINALGQTNYYRFNGAWFEPTPNKPDCAEYIDRNKNGRFDGYYLNGNTNNLQRIDFYSPFGGNISGEFDKEFLQGIHDILHYPEVDLITFKP